MYFLRFEEEEEEEDLLRGRVSLDFEVESRVCLDVDGTVESVAADLLIFLETPMAVNAGGGGRSWAACLSFLECSLSVARILHFTS